MGVVAKFVDGEGDDCVWNMERYVGIPIGSELKKAAESEENSDGVVEADDGVALVVKMEPVQQILFLLVFLWQFFLEGSRVRRSVEGDTLKEEIQYVNMKALLKGYQWVHSCKDGTDVSVGALVGVSIGVFVIVDDFVVGVGVYGSRIDILAFIKRDLIDLMAVMTVDWMAEMKAVMKVDWMADLWAAMLAMMIIDSMVDLIADLLVDSTADLLDVMMVDSMGMMMAVMMVDLI